MPAVSLGLVLVSFRGQNDTPTQGMSPLCFLRVDRVQADIPRLPPSPDSVVTCNTKLIVLQNPPSPVFHAALLSALPEPAGAVSCSSRVLVFWFLFFHFWPRGWALGQVNANYCTQFQVPQGSASQWGHPSGPQGAHTASIVSLCPAKAQIPATCASWGATLPSDLVFTFVQATGIN